MIAYIISRIGFDFASRNFDAYYAIQDGIFLSVHPSYQHLANSHEILPLTWSASTNDRYGVSYLIALLRYLHVGNPWSNAQYIMIFTLIVLILIIYSFLKKIFSLNGREKIIIFIVVSFSPAILIPLQYFMFGQVLGLAVAILAIAILNYQNVDKKASRYSLFISSTLLIIYPAMVFPVGLFWCIYLLQENGTSIIRRIFRVILTFGVAALIALVEFGFHFSILWKRIWTWIAGSLLSNSTTDNLQFQIKLFGQYSSKIGIPLYTGILRYPYTLAQSNKTVFVFLLISVSIFVNALFLIRKISERNSKSILVAFVFSWLLMAFIAYVTTNSYVFVKFSTWTMPIVLGTACLALLRNKILYTTKLKSLIIKIVSLASAVAIAMSLITSISYALTLKTWDSFPQVPKPNLYSSFNHLQIQGTQKIGVVSPTAEEAMWTAGLFGSVTQSRFLSLGVTNQALGAGLDRNCAYNDAEKAYDSLGYIVTNDQQWDIVPPLTFNKPPQFKIANYSVSLASNLKSALIINGGGLFPPSKIGFYDGHSIPSGALRWSSGEVCLAVFSSLATEKDIKMNFAPGPDLSSGMMWKLNVNGIMKNEPFTPGILTHKAQLNAGWNLIQIVQPGCYVDGKSRSGRWTSRVDDRKLCFAGTAISD